MQMISLNLSSESSQSLLVGLGGAKGCLVASHFVPGLSSSLTPLVY